LSCRSAGTINTNAASLLVHKIEEMYNLEPMVVEERNQQNVLVKRQIKHKFKAYPKLNKKIQEHYDALFAKRGLGKRSDEAPTKETIPVPFGFGAFMSHRFSSTGRKLASSQSQC